MIAVLTKVSRVFRKTSKNDDVEFPTFGEIAGVSLSRVGSALQYRRDRLTYSVQLQTSGEGQLISKIELPPYDSVKKFSNL